MANEDERAPEPDGRAAAPRTDSWFSEGPLRRLLDNASMLVGGRTLNGILNLSAMTLIVRSVGIETFGSLALIHALVSTIADIAKFQSWQAVLRYGAPALESGRTMDFRRLVKLTVLLDLASTVLGVSIAVIAAPILSSTFGWEKELVPLVQIYSFSIFFKVTATPTGLLRLFDRFDLLSVAKAAGSFVRVVGAIWILFMGGDLGLLLAVWFASTMASGFWLIGHSIRALAARDLLRGPRLGYRGLTTGHEGIAAFVWATQANTTLSAGNRSFGTVVVGLLLDTAAVGLFDISLRIASMLSRFSRLLRPAIYPEYARLSAQNDLPGIRQLMFRSIMLMVGFGSILVVPFVFFGRWILATIFGSELEAAYGVAVLLVLAAAVRLLAFPLEPALISTGRAGVALVSRAVTVTVYIVSLFVLIPGVGLIGAGLAQIASGLVSIAGQGLAVYFSFRSRSGEGNGSPS